MRLLTLDPAKTATGWAVFCQGTLQQAGGWKYSRKDPYYQVRLRELFAFYPIDRVLIERPQAAWKGKADDQITASLYSGVLLGTSLQRGKEGAVIRPRDWKGNLPKEVHHMRACKKLTQDEADIIRRGRCKTWIKSNETDMLDAVVLGLWCHCRVVGPSQPKNLVWSTGT